MYRVHTLYLSIMIVFIIYGINYYWRDDNGATAKQLPLRGNTRKP